MPANTPPILETADIAFARILWCDNANLIRAKAVRGPRFAAYAQHGVGISEAQQALPVMFDAPAPGSGLGPVGEIRLVPDLDTLTMLPYAPGHAQYMGDMVRDGQPWPVCPRFFLKRLIAAAAQQGLEVQAAFENEFYLLQESSQGVVSSDRTVFAMSDAMDRHVEVIAAIADALEAQGMPVEQYYPESGPGQQEISVHYTHALQAADRQIRFRETVRAVARRHRLIASFLPKIFADQAGSGCHVHLSLWRDGQNIMPDTAQPGQLSPIARQFMAGVLHHLPALMALTTPSPNSYRRIQPQTWSGAFQCWGLDNREAAVRVPTNPVGPSPTHVELKTVDATANPYLALGAIIAAGLDGIAYQRDLGAPVNLDPGVLSEAERVSRHIHPLPDRLGTAIEALERDTVLCQALGAELARAYLAVRRLEWESMREWGLDQEVQLLLERY
jgi:glutamine synthetase